MLFTRRASVISMVDCCLRSSNFLEYAIPLDRGMLLLFVVDLLLLLLPFSDQIPALVVDPVIESTRLVVVDACPVVVVVTFADTVVIAFMYPLSIVSVVVGVMVLLTDARCALR